jgi:hypothetical protein
MEHYLQVTESDFAKAAGRSLDNDEQGFNKETPCDGKYVDSEKAQHPAQQKALQDTGTHRNAPEQESENPGDFENHRDSLVPLAPRIGRIYELWRESATL